MMSHPVDSIIWKRPEDASFEQLLAALLAHSREARGRVESLSQALACLARNAKGLLYLDPEMIRSVPGMGQVRTRVILAAIELSRRQNSGDYLVTRKVNFHSLARHLQSRLEGVGEEYFYLFSFNNSFGLIREHLMARGGAEAVNVYFRDIVKVALNDKAFRVLIAHNHPDHSAKPSREDMQSMERLSGILKEIGIYLVDQYIVGLDGVYSCSKGNFLIQNEKQVSHYSFP